MEFIGKDDLISSIVNKPSKINRVAKSKTTEYFSGYLTGKAERQFEIIDIIEKQPTVCACRAHWIVSYDVAPTRTKKILICSHCGKSIVFDLDNKNEFHYCPLCGAKMDKKL